MFVNFMLAGAASYYIGGFIAKNGTYQSSVAKLPSWARNVAPALLSGLVLYGLHETGALKAVSKAV